MEKDSNVYQLINGLIKRGISIQWNTIDYTKEVLIHTRTQMNLENVVLNERSQTQRPYIV